MTTTERRIGSLTCLVLMATSFATLCYAVGELGDLNKGKGTKLVMELTDDSGPLNSEAAIGQTIAVLRARLKAQGVRSGVVEREPSQPASIVVLIPPVSNLDKIAHVLRAESGFELRLIATGTQIPFKTREAAESAMKGQPLGESNFEVMLYRERVDAQSAVQEGWVVVEKSPVLTVLDIRNAQAYSSEDDETVYEIYFWVNDDGARRLADATGKHIGGTLAIVLNHEVKSAPTINGQIHDRGQITGAFTKTAAEDLALILRSGALPPSSKLTYTSEEPVSASRWTRVYYLIAALCGSWLLALSIIFYLLNRRRPKLANLEQSYTR